MHPLSQYLRRRCLTLFTAFSASRSARSAFFLFAALQYPQITIAANSHTAANMTNMPLLANESICSISDPLLVYEVIVVGTLLLLSVNVLALILWERFIPSPVSLPAKGGE